MKIFDTETNTMLLPGEKIIKKKECEMQKEVKQKLYIVNLGDKVNIYADYSEAVKFMTNLKIEEIEVPVKIDSLCSDSDNKES